MLILLPVFYSSRIKDLLTLVRVASFLTGMYCFLTTYQLLSWQKVFLKKTKQKKNSTLKLWKLYDLNYMISFYLLAQNYAWSLIKIIYFLHRSDNWSTPSLGDSWDTEAGCLLSSLLVMTAVSYFMIILWKPATPHKHCHRQPAQHV